MRLGKGLKQARKSLPAAARSVFRVLLRPLPWPQARAPTASPRPIHRCQLEASALARPGARPALAWRVPLNPAPAKGGQTSAPARAVTQGLPEAAGLHPGDPGWTLPACDGSTGATLRPAGRGPRVPAHSASRVQDPPAPERASGGSPEQPASASVSEARPRVCPPPRDPGARCSPCADEDEKAQKEK